MLFEWQTYAHSVVVLHRVVQESTQRHGHPIAKPLLPQATDDAVCVDGRPKNGCVGQNAKRQPGSNHRASRVKFDYGARLQPVGAMMIERQLGGPVCCLQSTTDQVIGPCILGHQIRP